ncbi:tRNA 2-thiouridine(34) synthase MnmA [Granulicoccus sp. GXG6511]|uniref:tRNA 2-thiouridine(34) synthase MnmA n=1 Tax=Granulicoccus sp. GXG6511 TaxID=3381351 RepID=UPI003D7DF045
MRVLAAMSGGVDSAVAAARMVDAGHDVTGIHLALSKNPQSFRSGARGCCSLEDSHDARRAADKLGIPFYVWDFSDEFRDDVIEDFVSEYAAGRTPNPCLRCNEKIKFAAVLRRGLALGFDAVATGHYARLAQGPDGPELRRAVDPAKDQSYVLGMLGAEQLRHCAFPLGDSLKPDVRAEAERRGLRVAKKPDSHDICFIPTGDTAGFLERRLGAQPGEILDEDGVRLGEHQGTHRFTVGQRKGLRVGTPAADGRPRYVLSISPVDRRVVVGPKESLNITTIEAIRPTWTRQPLTAAWRGLVQVRAHGEPMPATVEPADRLTIRLDEPATGIAPGQGVVLYRDDLVVGSATIDATRTARAGDVAR